MSIKDKATYGEYYWAMQVEAQAQFDEDIESAFAPYFGGLLADIPEISELPVGLQSFMRTLAEPPSAGFGDLVKLTGAETLAEVLKDALQPSMSMLKRAINRKALETWLTAKEAVTLSSRKKIPDDYFYLLTASAGYEKITADAYFTSQQPYPSIPDLVLFSRYNGDPDNVWSTIQDFYNVDPVDFKVWEWLGKQRLTTLQVQMLYKRGIITESELYNKIAEIGWYGNDREFIEQLAWSIPNAMLLVQGDLFQQQDEDRILTDISIADINPNYAKKYLDAILTKPASQDIIAYQLRREPELSGLASELQRIGIHPNYTDLYKELAYVIPPVADIITMAVREAFTPEIAAKFGQYQDFPAELETWGLKKGLSKEWTERYWASHWSLPSAGQGFDMLHRGLIDMNELNMLLRALDVMPFWREKLTGIAYRRLSRVDIRRMYGVGVLDESGVLAAYLELGYNDRDANRMSEFTVKQILATQSKFTTRDIIAAYSKYMITRSEAASLLEVVGVRKENISFIISSAEYKRAWELTDNRVTAIRNLYKKEVYDADKARSELLKLDFPAERVNVLMEQWYIDEKDKPPRYWTTAQTLSFIKAELITPERGRAELSAIGYDDEHINVYMEASK